MSSTVKDRVKIMNLLEVVSTIRRDGYIATGVRATITHRLFSSFPFLDEVEKGWEVRVKKKVEVAADIRDKHFSS